MAHSRKDDLNLSLTGSQISAMSVRSASSRPNSAHTKRANSLVDVRHNTPQNEAHAGGDAVNQKRKGAIKDKEFSALSQHASLGLSITQPARKPANGASSKGNSQEDEFLTLFESSSQPKIKQLSSEANSNTLRKKVSTGTAKVLWSEPKPKAKTKKPAWASKPPSENNTSRSEEPYNMFHPASARSTDDELGTRVEMIEELGNSLSQSINKLQALQNQLSGVNRHDLGDNSGNNLAMDSFRSASSTSTLTPTRQLYTPASVGDFAETDNASHATSSLALQRLWDGEYDMYANSSLANNISRPGQMQKAKATLSSMENSYQNFKRKTPVNQVKSSAALGNTAASQSASRPGQQNITGNNGRSVVVQKQKTSVNSSVQKSLVQNMTEEYMTCLDSAATVIQKWYRRHRTRRIAAEAAMRRLLNQKKEQHDIRRQQEYAHSMTSEEIDARKAEERKRIREEKAKESRQQAVKDLQRKREERKSEVKKIALDEIKYLQASGKVTKTSAANSYQGKKKRKVADKESPKEGINPRELLGNPGSQELSEDMGVTHVGATHFRNGEAPGGGQESDKGTEAGTRTTLEDLYSTLKKLEEEENFLSVQTEKKSWLDDLEKAQEEELGSNLTAENLEKLNSSKDGLSKSGFLTDNKLRSIIDFLDEVQVNDRLSGIEMEISRVNDELEKPAFLVPSAEQVAQLEQAQATASEVTNTLLTQRLELDEKKRTVTMLQKALNQQRELTVRHARETEKEMKKRLDVQKEEYEEAIKRHLSFIDQLIDDKKNLSEKCEKLVNELKTIDKKYQDKIKSLEDSHVVEMTKLKEVHAAAEKLRREKWIEDKTKKIKEMTVKGLEPEIQRLIAKHKSDINKLKHIHEAELLEADERVAQKYVKMTEELRDQLAAEKEAACAREREMSKQRYEKQLQQEEEAYQQQRRRLHQEVQEEKDRVAASVSRQRAELEKLQRQLEDNHRIALESMKEDFMKAREEQERRHATEIRNLQEKLKLEKESWEENYMKRHETWLVQKERELRDKIKKERDKEIELVIERLEEDASTVREENEKSTEQKIRRLREKFEIETRELEQSERRAVKKYNEIKAKLAEVEGENERAKVIIKQKEQDMIDNKKLIEKMNSERGHVSDIIRQEFADRIVATDEENKRIKHEISELRARHRIELEKAHTALDDLRKTNEEEMEKVHQRVKQAIVKKEEVVAQLKQQYQAANKRADHLEGLLEQQRKQLLNKK
ncbi:hypothetical protein BsWGS_06503 [Bradybaena similaris]